MSYDQNNTLDGCVAPRHFSRTGNREAPISAALITGLLGAMVATSFLSGIFGMAGGVILMGILLALLSVPEAMALHAVAQISSNGWRGLLWIGHVKWRAVAAYVFGCLVAMVLWSALRYVPSKPVALLALGATPFLLRLLPQSLKPDPERWRDGLLYGSVCMSLMLLTGVAGPLLDSYFLGGRLERRQIVATKAICQIFGHSAKLLYFGGLVEQAATLDPWLAVAVVAASMIGTMAAKPVLERLSETQYRTWATRIITTIALVYLVHGSYLLAAARF
jgi:uncharacterized protein